MLFASLMIPFFIFTSAYRGALVSILTVELPGRPLNTMEDLARNNITVGSAETHACNSLAKSKNPWAKEIAKSCYAYNSYEAGFQRARIDPKFAISEGRTFLDYKRREIFSNKYVIHIKIH